MAGEGEGGGRGAESYDSDKARFSFNHSLLSGNSEYSTVTVNEILGRDESENYRDTVPSNEKIQQMR
jgi:hypothetical protein